MKKRTILLTMTLAAAVCALALTAGAVESKDAKAKSKAKPYPLKTCVVSDEKLDADPGMKSHVFVHEGQEVKLCCKNCLKDFKKDPAKYLKKIDEAAKAKK